MPPRQSGPGAMAGATEAGSITDRQYGPDSTAPHSAPATPPMRLESFKPVVKGAVRGFTTIRLPIGLTIADIPVCTSHGRTWATPPSTPVFDREGQHFEQNVKRKYAPVLAWADRKTADRCSAAELMRWQYPAALDHGSEFDEAAPRFHPHRRAAPQGHG